MKRPLGLSKHRQVEPNLDPAQLPESSSFNGRSWPFFRVNEGFNGAESDFRFVLESGRSECTRQGSA
jgi:hypothetical protein